MSWDNVNSNVIDNIKIYYYEKDDYIGNMIRNGIWYDDNIINIIKNNRINNKDILDIGAFIGTVSLRLYDVIKNEENSRIHAFEPRYHKCLERSINSNKMNDKIILHPIGLANHTGYIKDHLNNNPDIRSLGSQPIALFHNGLNETPISSQLMHQPLDNSNYFKIMKLDDLQLLNIGFIKIDAESMEIEVIKGSMQTLKNNNYPPIYIELLSCTDNDPVKVLYDKHSEEVIKILTDIGYTINKEFIKGKHDDYLFIHTNLQ